MDIILGVDFVRLEAEVLGVRLVSLCGGRVVHDLLVIIIDICLLGCLQLLASNRSIFFFLQVFRLAAAALLGCALVAVPVFVLLAVLFLHLVGAVLVVPAVALSLVGFDEVVLQKLLVLLALHLSH